MKPAIGKTRFRLEPISSRRLQFRALTSCLQCGRPVTIELGAVGAVFRVGQTFLGVSCDACLTPESRALANELREQQRAGAR